MSDEGNHPTTVETPDQITENIEVPETLSLEEAQTFLEQSNRFYSTYFIPDTCNIPYVELRERAQRFQNWMELTRSVIFDPDIELTEEEISQAMSEMEYRIETADTSTTLFERTLAPFIVNNLNYYAQRKGIDIAEQLERFVSKYKEMILGFSNEQVVSSSMVALTPEYSNHAKFLMNAARLRLEGVELNFDRYRGFRDPVHARNYIRAYSLQEIFRRYTPALGLKSIDITHSESDQEYEPRLPGIPNRPVVLPHGKLCDLVDEILLFGMPMIIKETDAPVLIEDMFPHFLFGVNYLNNSSTNPNTISRLKHVERTSSLLKPEIDSRRVFEAYLNETPLNGRIITAENVHEFLTCDDLTIWLTIRFVREFEDYVERAGSQLTNPNSFSSRYRAHFRSGGFLGLAEGYADLWLDAAFTNYEAETTTSAGTTSHLMPSLIEVAISEYRAGANRSVDLGELNDPAKLREHLKYSMLALGLEVNSGAVVARRNDIEILKSAARNVSLRTPTRDIISMIRGFSEFRTENTHIPLETLEHLNAARPHINELLAKDLNVLTNADKVELRNYFADIIQVRQIGIRRNTSPIERNTKIKKQRGSSRI